MKRLFLDNNLQPAKMGAGRKKGFLASLKLFTSVCYGKQFKTKVRLMRGFRHLSLKIPNVKFNINALIGQNLTSKLKIRVLIIACKREFDIRF